MRSRIAFIMVALSLLVGSVVQAEVSAEQRNVPDAETSFNGYLTRVESDTDEILKLENGAVVELTSGYLGYIGYRKKAVLYRTESGFKIWIEGKRVYRCDLLREPAVAKKVAVEEFSISSITDDGDILKAMDGRVFEVNSLYTLYTKLWLAPFEAARLSFVHYVGKCDRCGRFHVKCLTCGEMLSPPEDDPNDHGHQCRCKPPWFWLASVEEDEHGAESAELHAVLFSGKIITADRRSL